MPRVQRGLVTVVLDLVRQGSVLRGRGDDKENPETDSELVRQIRQITGVVTERVTRVERATLALGRRCSAN